MNVSDLLKKIWQRKYFFFLVLKILSALTWRNFSNIFFYRFCGCICVRRICTMIGTTLCRLRQKLWLFTFKDISGAGVCKYIKLWCSLVNVLLYYRKNSCAGMSLALNCLRSVRNGNFHHTDISNVVRLISHWVNRFYLYQSVSVNHGRLFISIKYLTQIHLRVHTFYRIECIA